MKLQITYDDGTTREVSEEEFNRIMNEWSVHLEPRYRPMEEPFDYLKEQVKK